MRPISWRRKQPLLCKEAPALASLHFAHGLVVLERRFWLTWVSFASLIVISQVGTRKYFTGKTSPLTPNLLMGAALMLAAFMCIFFVPETRGVPLPDSKDEAISNKR